MVKKKRQIKIKWLISKIFSPSSPGFYIALLCLSCSSVTKFFPTLHDPMDFSTPGFPVLHYLPEFSQTNVHWSSDVIQPSHPLMPPSLPALSLSQHQGLYVSSGIKIVRYFEKKERRSNTNDLNKEKTRWSGLFT